MRTDARFERTVACFKKYGEQYDFDPLMLAALAYQESGLDQSVRSRAGAVGVMQVLPSTAADPNVGIPDITTLENNIHAGTKYLRFLRDRYFSDPESTAQPDPLQLRRLQRRARTVCASCARRRRGPGSTRTSGSATSSTWPPNGSAARPCSTSATSPSIRSRTS